MEPRWKILLPELVDRHRVVELKYHPWFKIPVTVNIAIYADRSIRFNGGSFDGLQRVIAALASDPWPWIRFKVTLIHRGVDPSADLEEKQLDQIDINKFDELWLFGISSTNVLSGSEIDAIHNFMDNGGGVLHTGDHANLGKGLAGEIKRAGKMRQYPAPPASFGVWNNTLRSGNDGIYNFTDQSDDTPQSVRLKYYSSWSWYPSLCARRYPHPVFCGKDGPIRVFPDHQHEGEAIAPTSYPATEWPSKNGFQPKVEVVAWGNIIDPDSDVGREVGLVSVYNGHQADVGRILADSTWHHWFDINLDGFSNTTKGKTHLNKIEQYFLNVAAWLAPKSKQSAMRNGLAIFASWRDPLVMLDPSVLQPRILGGMARDALGQFAPQCLIRWWILDMLPARLFEESELINPDLESTQSLPLPIPIEDIVLGNAIAPILQHNLEVEEPENAVSIDFVEDAFAKSRLTTAEVLRDNMENYEKIDKLCKLLEQ